MSRPAASPGSHGIHNADVPVQEVEKIRSVSALDMTPGSLISGRYQVVRQLGAGAAGVVYSAKDRASGLVVAVKILGDPAPKRSHPSAKEELIYNRLVCKGSPAVNLFARVFGSGLHGSLRYIAFELGGCTLLDVINMPSLYPLPRRHLREIATQLLSGLHFLHSLSIVHADLKPNNIVLRSAEVAHVRRMGSDDAFVSKPELVTVELFIIDLGEAQILDDDEGHGCVGASCYRAPEVTLGMPWSYGVDAFAAGCVLVELSLGKPLFEYTEVDIIRLALVERVLGPFPTALARRAEKKRPGTFILGFPPKIRFPPPPAETSGGLSECDVKKVVTAMPLTRLIYDHDFLELCDWLLDLDPVSREDVADCYCLDFIVNQDDEFVSVDRTRRRM